LFLFQESHLPSKGKYLRFSFCHSARVIVVSLSDL
jgi:hypothetical protein